MELVLDGLEKPFNYEEIEYNGIKMMVEKIASDQYRIVRLITTNPEDYLSAQIQPGSILTYQPVLNADSSL